MRLSIYLVLFVLILGEPIVHAHVRLNSPEGGEIFVSGDELTIQWQIQVQHPQINWDLYFSPDNGLTWNVIVKDLEVGEIEYVWTVPDIETLGGMIRIVQDNVAQNYSDNSGPFIIISELTGPLLSPDPMIIDFKSVEVNNEIIVDVRLENQGIQELSISDFSDITAPFELTGVMTLPINISPGEAYDIKVNFNPVIDGEFADTIWIESNSQISDVKIILAGGGAELSKAVPNICYATTGLKEGGSLLLVNLTNGVATKIADMDGIDLSQAIAINSMLDAFVIDPISNSLNKISCSSGKSSEVQSLEISDIAMDFDNNDVLYFVGLDASDNRNLYSLNIDENSVNTVGELATRFTGISFDPTSDIMYGITKEGDLFTIDKLTAVTSLLGSAGKSNMTDIAFDIEGKLYGLYGGGNSINNQLILIDKVTGNTLADLGGTGFTSVAGLAIAGEMKVLSLASMDSQKEISAYPNPFVDRIYIHPPNANYHEIEAAIYSTTGKLITILNNFDSNSYTFWDGTDSQGHRVEPGIYLIVVHSRDRFKTKKILFR
jgi:hypothetical protein